MRGHSCCQLPADIWTGKTHVSDSSSVLQEAGQHTQHQDRKVEGAESSHQRLITNATWVQC